MLSLKVSDERAKRWWETGSRWGRRCGKEACHPVFKEQLCMARDGPLWVIGFTGTFSSRLSKKDDRTDQLILALLR